MEDYWLLIIEWSVHDDRSILPIAYCLLLIALRPSLLQHIHTPILRLQHMIIMICLGEQVAESLHPVFFIHIEIISNAGKNDILFYTTQHHPVEFKVFL